MNRKAGLGHAASAAEQDAVRSAAASTPQHRSEPSRTTPSIGRIPVEGAHAAAPGDGPAVGRARMLALRLATAAASALLGFLLVAQVQTSEALGDRLATEREEDLARILAGLSAESDRLQSEITELRLTLIEFESSAERDALALRSLQRRLEELQVLAGTVATEGEGLTLTVADPRGDVGPELLVDAVQELRDAGAEAIAVNGVRLVTSSWFANRNDRLIVDGKPLEQPYRIAVVGPGQTMAKALEIPGGVVDSLTVYPQVSADVEVLAQLELPARPEPVPFVFSQPLPADADDSPGR